MCIFHCKTILGDRSKLGCIPECLWFTVNITQLYNNSRSDTYNKIKKLEMVRIYATRFLNRVQDTYANQVRRRTDIHAIGL